MNQGTAYPPFHNVKHVGCLSMERCCFMCIQWNTASHETELEQRNQSNIQQLPNSNQNAGLSVTEKVKWKLRFVFCSRSFFLVTFSRPPLILCFLPFPREERRLKEKNLLFFCESTSFPYKKSSKQRKKNERRTQRPKTKHPNQEGGQARKLLLPSDTSTLTRNPHPQTHQTVTRVIVSEAIGDRQ